MIQEDYQYATMSAYSPTMSETPLQGGLDIQASSTHNTDDGQLSNWSILDSLSRLQQNGLRMEQRKGVHLWDLS
jgi:hypothetical protein